MSSFAQLGIFKVPTIENDPMVSLRFFHIVQLDTNLGRLS
jgi:hypothetical protein